MACYFQHEKNPFYTEFIGVVLETKADNLLQVNKFYKNTLFMEKKQI